MEKVISDDEGLNEAVNKFLGFLTLFYDMNLFVLTTSTAEEIAAVKNDHNPLALGVFFTDHIDYFSYMTKQEPIPSKFPFIIIDNDEITIGSDDLRCLGQHIRKPIDEKQLQTDYEKVLKEAGKPEAVDEK